MSQSGMEKAGAHPHLVAAILEESRLLKLHVNFQDCSTTVPFNKCLKQGGKESPPIFRDGLIAVLMPTIRRWKRLKIGVDMDGFLLNHLIWADNIFLFAETQQQLRMMILEIGNELEKAKMHWKADSLKIMSTDNEDLLPDTIRQGRRVFKIEKVDKMMVLGTEVDQRGCSKTSAIYRMKVAEKKCFAERWTLTLQRAFPTSTKLWCRVCCMGPRDGVGPKTWLY